ncbi:MAG: YqgE/AlgH family protein [Actinomycetota bacterium]|nr:YqgE/AlgH family protein [Actinomycetota bacterium]
MIDFEDIRAGRVLVATPGLKDPHFARTVVLVLEHDRGGTLGIVLNRPLDVTIVEVLPDWTGEVSAPERLFGGGPVSNEAALAVGLLTSAAFDEDSDGTDADEHGGLVGWRTVFGRVGLVDLDAPAPLLDGALSGLRIFAGYAGWSPGQLEMEIESGSWVVVDGEDADLTTHAPNGLWSQVLRRQRGDLRLLSTFPPDPSQN